MKLKVLKQVQMWYLDESDHPPVLQETSHGWAIRNGFGSSFVLTTRGSWEFETPPSKRLDDFDSFLALYRFKTAEEAIDAYLNFKEPVKFKIRYRDPETQEEVSALEVFQDTKERSAKEWAQDYASTLAGEDWYTVEEVKQ